MSLWNRRKSICSTMFSNVKNIKTLIFFTFVDHQSTLFRNLFWARNFHVSYLRFLSSIKTKKFENLSDRNILLNLNEKFACNENVEKFRFRRDFNYWENFLFNCSNWLTRCCFCWYLIFQCREIFNDTKKKFWINFFSMINCSFCFF